jgi:hypothetical protein
MLRIATFLLAITAFSASQLFSCDTEGSGYAKFTSKTVGQVKLGATLSFSGKCFETVEVTMTQHVDKFTADIVTKKHKGGVCVEFIIVTTGKSSSYSLIYLEAKKTHTFEVAKMSTAEREYVAERGLYVLRSCDNLLNLPQNIFMTMKLFVGGLGLNPNIPVFGSKIPDYQLHANMEFAEMTTGYKWRFRENPKTIKIDKHSIKSGDYLSIIRFDGLDNLIHLGTGSRSGHNTIAMWRDNELWVLESQDAWYWPRHGIQKNKWDDWIKWAENADFNVVVIPLKDEMRAKFDVEKAWAEFERLEGHTYGYSNFLFGYIDTVNENMPDWLDLIFITTTLKVLEHIIPSGISRVFYEPLNMRLGTAGLNIEGIWEEIYKRKISMAELWAMIEQEGWKYPTGENYVCSAFVVKMYKAGGLFGDLPINSTEFTPKDLYELAFFDVSGAQVPAECKDFAPHGYCQVTGRVHLDLGKMNWVEPYEHMAESCPTIAPDYNRKDKC